MSKTTGLLAATALVLAGLVVTPAFAQEKVPEGKIKQIDENDKIRVVEVTYQPGEGNASAKRPMRVVYAIKGGTLERTYADGTKETTEWKAGETKIISEARPYSIKNVGKTVIQYLVVFVK
jgi:mannose-6-phosphate isomerase-like protein (cupin superfamily)